MDLGMGKTGILFLIVWACCGAERQYFHQKNASTWEEARKHCQSCYKELVSLTADNIQFLAQNLDADYWVGLRKNLSDSRCWSRWSNGDPLTFQNWYPGRPKLPKPNMCAVNLGDSCSNINITKQSYLADDVCMIQVDEFCMNTTGVTRVYPMCIPHVEEEVEPSENSCVTLLSSGMWIELSCDKPLPYICYEDRFYANATVSNVTVDSMTVSWMAGPGDIKLYRVEVRGDIHLTENTTNLTMNFSDLTSGTKYRVQVFPVRCDRDLNPKNVTFYTEPKCVRNLTVNVTIDSAFLSWVQPVGNHSFYKVTVNGHSSLPRHYNENIQIENLRPGENYTFIVNAEVEDQSRSGDTVSTSAYTIPDKVSQLNATEDKGTITLTWMPPEGSSCCYRVCVQEEKKLIYFNKTFLGTNLTLKNLTAGTEFQLTVAALAGLMPNDLVKGEAVTIMYTTVPSPVSNLTLNSSSGCITAVWNHPVENFYRLKLGQGPADFTEITTNETSHTFKNLKSGVPYNVTVYTELTNKSLLSEGVSKCIFTLPLAPERIYVTSYNMTSISLKWDVPKELQDSMVNYEVKFTADFWKHTERMNVTERNVTFNALKPGTKYTFEVKTLAGVLESESIPTFAFTVPNNKTLILMIQCSSVKQEDCENKTKILEDLKNIVRKKLQDQVTWNLELKEK
ncbi:receptor-type tyrosine-protein phosphatase eta-like [Conger conger]|uniref:receptor-type tyrosine-protein phosphatase eta-like n=1 Tax=Conger conger TaxID=82655 RepID=UPI002A59D1C3|nr:receptor-type tyrosine-protein phosphatase eta-like [Conger conger]